MNKLITKQRALLVEKKIEATYILYDEHEYKIGEYPSAEALDRAIAMIDADWRKVFVMDYESNGENTSVIVAPIYACTIEGINYTNPNANFINYRPTGNVTKRIFYETRNEALAALISLLEKEIL